MNSGDIGQHCGSFFVVVVDGQRLTSNVEVCGCYWGGKRKRLWERCENSDFWEVHVPSKWKASWLTSGRDIGQMNVCMDELRRKKGRKFSSAPGFELVKLEPARETGCGSWWISLSSFVLIFGFKNAWRSISRHFISWFGNSPSCLATRNIIQLSSANVERAT